MDKKRSSEFEAIRRLQFNAMKKMTSQLPAQLRAAQQQMMQQPMQQQSPPTQAFDFPMKKEPNVAEITEIDSGCESPQEQASPMVIIYTVCFQMLLMFLK